MVVSLVRTATLRATCLLLLLNAPAQAQNYVWIAGSTPNNTWGYAFNWLNLSIPPTGGGTRVFMAGNGGISTVADFFGNHETWQIRELAFDNLATDRYMLDGGSLIVEDRIRNQNGFTHTLALPIRLSNTSLTIDALAGDLQFFDPVRFTQNNSILTVTGGKKVLFFGLVRDPSVSQAEVRIESDTVVRIGGNTSGVTQWTVDDGMLELQTHGSFGATAAVQVASSGRLDLRGVNAIIGELTGSGPVVTGSDSTGFGRLTIGNSSNFTYSGVMHGNLTKTGSGTFTMDAGIIGGPSTPFGIIIEAGTLRVGSGSGILGTKGIYVDQGATLDLNGKSQSFDDLGGSGTVKLSGVTLTLNHSGPRVASARIEGPGTLAKSGSGGLFLSNSNNTFSTLQINAGAVEVSNSGALGSGNIVIADATLRPLATMTSSRPISLNSSASKISVESTRTLTQNGVISGSGGLNKLGTGVLVLGAVNSYSGNTNITSGTLRLSASDRISNLSNVVMSAGATFELSNTGSETVASLSGNGTLDTRTSARLTVNAATGSTTFAGNIIGGGGINKQGGHTLVLTGSNTYTGITNITGGTLRGSVGNSSRVTVGSGATWNLNGASQAVGAITGGGNIDVKGASLVLLEESVATRTFSGNISGVGGLDMRGSHTLVLTGNNSYLNTGIKGGVLRVASNDNLGTGAIVFEGGTLHTTGSFTSDRPIVFENGAPAIFDVDASTTLTQTGSITGSGSFAKIGAGMLVLRGNNSFNGELFLQDGMLSVSSSNHLGDTSLPIIFFGGTLRTTASFENSRSVTIGPINSGSFYVAGPTTLTQSGTISGDSTSTLIKDGGGVLRLVGSLDSTFSGSIAIKDGALELFRNASASFGSNIGGDGSLHKGGTGVYSLSGTLTYGGETRVEAGTLRRSGGSGLPNSTDLHVAVGAVYDLNNVSDTINALNGQGSVTLGSAISAKTLTLGSAGGSGTFSGVISGTLGHLAKTGSGTQVLSGNNSYSQTFFNGGVLSTASSANLGSGQLNFNGGRWHVTGTFTNSRTISGPFSFGTIDVQSGHTLTQTGNITGPFASLNKVGEGTLVFSGTAFVQNKNINNGMLQFSGGSGFSTSTNVTVASGATWDLNGVSDTVATIAGAGAIQLNAGSQLTLSGNSSGKVFSGVLSGNGALVKGGTHQLTLTGSNTHSGGTAINGGIMTISSNANLGSAAAPLSFNGGTLRTSGTFTIDRSVTLNTNGSTIDANGNLLVSGAFAGPGSLTKSAGGTLQLTGDSPSYAGPIYAESGTLLVNAQLSAASINVGAGAIFAGAGSVGAVVNEGQVSPGNLLAAAGSLNVVGDFTQNAGGILDIELAGISPGTSFDQLVVAGLASLSGTLAVSLLDGFVPAAGDVFAIVTGGRISGAFDDVLLPTLDSGFLWDLDYHSNEVLLSVVPVFSADFNNDGIVDGDDLAIWQNAFGATADANADGDGYSDGHDFLTWQQQFGSGMSALEASQAVPEPSGLVLLVLGAAGLLRRGDRGRCQRSH